MLYVHLTDVSCLTGLTPTALLCKCSKPELVLLLPLFPQECWCKKGAPSPELFTTYKMQPQLPERSSRNSSSSSSSSADAEQVAALTSAADVIGQLLQNHHQVRCLCVTCMPQGGSRVVSRGHMFVYSSTLLQLSMPHAEQRQCWLCIIRHWKGAAWL
jgi:hypothetical protein